MPLSRSQHRDDHSSMYAYRNTIALMVFLASVFRGYGSGALTNYFHLPRRHADDNIIYKGHHDAFKAILYKVRDRYSGNPIKIKKS